MSVVEQELPGVGALRVEHTAQGTCLFLDDVEVVLVPASSSALWASGAGVGVRKCRRKAGMSQAVLAEKTGVSRQTIVSWERGSVQPRARHLAVVAAALNVSVAELMG